MGLLDGRSALVTGAAGDIGSETAAALGEQGARLILTDLKADGLEATAEELRGRGFEVCARAGNLTREEDIAAIVAFGAERYGGIDILDNNAGATGFSARDLDVVGMPAELWDEIQAINARGPMLLCKHVIPHMLTKGSGSIVNITSGQALSGDVSNFAYASGKAALNALTRHLATRHGHQGIRVNAVAPGLIVSPKGVSRLPQRVTEIFTAHCLVPRLGVPRDIANMVVFLASDLAAYVTGQVISVDGGILAHIPTVVEMSPIIDQMRDAGAGKWS